MKKSEKKSPEHKSDLNIHKIGVDHCCGVVNMIASDILRSYYIQKVGLKAQSKRAQENGVFSYEGPAKIAATGIEIFPTPEHSLCCIRCTMYDGRVNS